MRELWQRVAEPSEGLVHLVGAGIIGGVTLCGKADWLGCPKGDGAPTKDPCNCQGCLGVVEHVHSRGLPAELRGGPPRTSSSPTGSTCWGEGGPPPMPAGKRKKRRTRMRDWRGTDLTGRTR